MLQMELRDRPTKGRPRILVVDDKAGVPEALKVLLEREGYDVQTAGDAWGAVREIKPAPVDCLVVDMDLSPHAELGLTGADVIALLRIHQPKAKAILVSGAADPALTRLAWERGAVAWLEKPVDLAALKHLLRGLCFAAEGPTSPPSPVLRPSGGTPEAMECTAKEVCR